MSDLEGTTAIDIDAGIARWENFPASYISHHGAACCEIAREWIIGMDFSQLNAGHPLTGPRWLRKNFKWGPSKWPMHWCEAVREETLDCGALGALSHALYVARGVRSFPAQFILEFNDVSTRHWTETWGAAGSGAPWISEGLIYHEGCAVVLNENEIKLWDATATWWINEKQFGGYAGLLAVRVSDSEAAHAPPAFAWGQHRIPPNKWHKIEPATADFATAVIARKTTSKPRPRARKAAPRTAIV
ncbi:MAG: hypothetical protein M3Z64_07065 [Verrucomicrobiota bacterium]|nr:hypothetical protein [Verrucomicrobiota bacterium]